LDDSFKTMCPHCGKELSIPYQEIKRHNTRIMGRLSVKKRMNPSEHGRLMSRARWDKQPKKEE
jgi:hypothetical protein